MHRDRFRRLVQRAIRSIPAEMRRELANVEVVIEREPSSEELAFADGAGSGLLGLYIGTPLTERSEYGLTTPDRIVIYQGPLERTFHPSEFAREVRATVIHEIAHHFGIDDDRLHEMGVS